MNLKNQNLAKMASAKVAADLVQDNMIIGLGTGSTAAYLIQELGNRVAKGLKIKAVATSKKSEELAKSLNIEMLDINSLTSLDLCIDGADEIDGQKQMIKGGGGAFFREKIVAHMSDEMIVIVDQSKLVDQLGKFLLPIEIIPFANQVTMEQLKPFGTSLHLRQTEADTPLITDNHNFIVDLQLKMPAFNLETLNAQIKAIPGVCETGLFLNMAGRVIVGFEDGHVEIC